MLLETHKIYLEHKASFIQISIITSFNSFLIACCGDITLVLDSSVVSLKSSLWPTYTKYETIFSKKIMFYYQTFFLLQICSLLDCSQQIPGKKIGGHRACFFANCCERCTWKRSQSGWIICAAETGARYKIKPIVFEVCTRDQARFRMFLCV